MTSFSLVGRTALVTGASRGIGRTLAIGLADAGADLVIAARGSSDLAETGEQIESRARRCLAVEMDVMDLGSIEAGFETMANKGFLPDVLVNNAGVEEVMPSLEVDATLWHRILDTNLRGAFFVAQGFAKPLVEAKRPGAIVNLCSLTSGAGIPTAVPYCSSKSGLLGMTRALAAEWAPHGIRVNGIGPGYFRTELTEVFYRDEAWQERMREKIPLGRFGELPDLVGATVFLASNASAYVTGQLLYIDGGTMAAL